MRVPERVELPGKAVEQVEQMVVAELRQDMPDQEAG
jgi:hypothetical protein